VSTVGNDLRFALRLLVKDRWFTCATVMALALGIGVNTTVFTILNGMNLTDLPVERADQIMHLDTTDQRGRRQGVSYADFLDWQRTAGTITGLAAYTGAALSTMNVGEELRPAERLQGTFISTNAFAILRKQPILGRDFRAEDEQPGASPVAILAHAGWMDRYGADPSVIGRSIRINGVPTTVIGVMPQGFRFPVLADLWQPLGLVPGLTTQPRDARGLGVFGRLDDHATLEQARAELTTIAAALSAQYPATNRDVRATVVTFRERYMGRLTAAEPMMMMCAVGFVLLIACVNAANLLLARSAQRRREISLRAALGASRGRIIRQLLIESAVIAALAGLCGLALAVSGMRLFTTETGDLNLPYWVQFNFAPRVFAFVAVISMATALLFGVAPAWQLAKTTAHDVLKEGGRGGPGSVRTRRWTSTLVVAELALTIVLLAGAGLLVRSALVLHAADGIVDSANVMTARL
jgi:putative ABC transport system permease protein